MNALPILVFILSAGSAPQQLPISSPAATSADSLAAIHQVFRYARRWSWLASFGLGVSVSAQAVVLATGNFTPFHWDLYLLGAAGYTGFGLRALWDGRRFGKRHERQAVARFEAHQAQPAYVRQ